MPYFSEDGFIFLKEGKNCQLGINVQKVRKLNRFNCLCFLNKNNNTIFILDEPDLSMHIEWQEL